MKRSKPESADQAVARSAWALQDSPLGHWSAQEDLELWMNSELLPPLTPWVASLLHNYSCVVQAQPGSWSAASQDVNWCCVAAICKLLKACVCGKSTTGRKNIFRRTDWSSSQIIRLLLKTEDKEERCSIFLLWGGKMVKGRMDWDPKNGRLVLGSAVSSGKALDTPAHLIHLCEMEIISSMINRDFVRRISSTERVLSQGGRAVSKGVLWFH